MWKNSTTYYRFLDMDSLFHTNSLMMNGRNNGKKLMTIQIIKHAMEIIHSLTVL